MSAAESASRSSRRARVSAEPTSEITPERRATRALRIVYGTVLPRMRSDISEGRLGYSRPSNARMMVRSHDYMVAVAADCQDWWYRVVRECERASSAGHTRRVERSHMEDAALEIADAVLSLPGPQRDVVVLRASGASWADVRRALPDRVYFSMADDWDAALRTLIRDHDDSIGRLA